MNIVKQHLEGILSKTLINQDYWYLKLQVNPLAHTTMPADYIVLTNKHNYLIECKESKNGRFEFKRLTQEKGLWDFELRGKNFHSYVLICFWNTTKKNSEYYLIPMFNYKTLKYMIDKKSFNIKDARTFLEEYTVTFINTSGLDINMVIK